MRLNSRRQLRVEGLETRMMLAADVAAVSDAYVESANDATRVVGDADGDGTFSSSDLVEIFQAGKYMSDQAADWSEGDWNGDNVFDSGDLVFAFQSGNYEIEGAAAKSARTNESANTVRLPAGSSDGDLAAAIATAGPRGTVILEAGIHTESSSVMITHPVTIVGEEGAVIEFDSEPATTSPRLIDAGFHVKNTRQVQIQGLEIRDNDAGSTAILIEGSDHVSIEDNQITDFQFGVLVESANHSTLDGNDIGMSSGRLPVTSFDILVVNGFGNQVRDNTVSDATFGIFVSGENGKLLNNTSSDNFVGIMLCNLPANVQLPDGRVSGSDVPATRWLVQGNTSTNNDTVGYLVIDGSNNNTLTNNRGGGNGTYDIELTPLTNRFGLFNLPASYDNVVNAGSHQDTEIKDCGTNNRVHGGDQVDTDLDACPVI